MQEFKIKRFEELSVDELYDILHLRSEVFVVEQNCPYLDIDKKDSKAIHVLGYLNGELASYCRMFNAGDYFKESSIGRVVVSPKYRSLKLGHELMKVAIDTLEDAYDQKNITISAQEYLVKFYKTHGFIQTSEVYLEDDIPHIEMKRKSF
ncbi:MULTISPECIES: GNAT family N-acetyltransferase [Flavobacterium]|uniref:GNAT family N-acetyltransferase n=2 Tax=Flavobacterium TaxID=237 RepID=A0AA94F328_9FLAO|nr:MULTISPECIES: GNAT family N-acetyltransferase [Flavobacterium]OXA75952.1 GNAT family N-acetyltransferase [Flavobacterium columnare NBRC 100251 = ATCC 23463]AMA50513.1 GNAT family acetyltransferase [Flavobacterium covae]AND63965.1 GNAT family acetyltransferase [Flavobacterium covae]MCH4829474.1 GNAT family N-acetyltransferase [Flavobacterium columnare]MCH4831531.1 GNAT family N-acetyltransferase [Flavobacterium columnare]